MCTSFKYFI